MAILNLREKNQEILTRSRGKRGEEKTKMNKTRGKRKTEEFLTT
jgi:hypothetical protein